MITKQTEALKLALEDLLLVWKDRPSITAIREALAEQPAQQGPSAKAPGMAVQALAGEIIEALLADEKDEGYDLTAGLFGPKFSALVRRWAAAEWSTSPPASKPWVGLEPKDFTGMDMSDAFEAGAYWADNKLREKNAAPCMPLTDEQIAKIAATPCAVAGSYVHTFARAIEAAHGIKGDA